MRNLDKYKGVIPAFYACYDTEGNVSPEGVQALTRYFVGKGVKGVYVNGSSGECIYQSVEDKKIILENVIKAAEGKLTVIAHVACNNTKDSMELARHAESLGVDAIAAIPPIYFRLPEHAIAQYWNDISNAVPNTDFVIYNIPQLAGVALTMNLFAEMRKNPRVIGVKNSSMPVQDIQMFKAEAGDNYVIFNGPDEQFISGRVIGAEERFWEAHKNYLDVHLMLHGTEQIDLNFIHNMKHKEFVQKDDFLPMNGEKNSSVILRNGDFLICYPSDGHRTAVAVGESQKIKKAIFKVRIS